MTLIRVKLSFWGAFKLLLGWVLILDPTLKPLKYRIERRNARDPDHKPRPLHAKGKP